MMNRGFFEFRVSGFRAYLGFQACTNGQVAFRDLFTIPLLRQGIAAAAFNHPSVAQKRIAVGFSAHPADDDQKYFKQTNRHGDTRAAVLPDLIESGIKELGERCRRSDHPQLAILVVTVSGRDFSFGQPAEPAPRRSMQLIAVNGSLMPVDRARTATSTSWSIVNFKS